MQYPSAYGAATRALHAGRAPDGATGAMIAPIHQSTTFARESFDAERAHSYSRVSNPGVVELERALAAFESAGEAVAFATGMSATAALFLALARPGDRIVCGEQVYGGTTRFIDELLAPFGVEAVRIDGRDLPAFAAAIDRRTKLVFVESPSNPTLSLTDIAGLAAICRDRGVPLAVDNTFMTALGQDCRGLGAGIRLQSTTKYVDGHNATLGGLVTTEDAGLAERLRRLRKTLGLGQKPFEAWLTLQGLQTLPLRFERQCRTARELACFLEDRRGLRRVLHSSLRSHPQYELARRQQSCDGAIIAFELEGGREAVARFVSRLSIVRLAENLGAAQSLVTHPASMTHADVDEDSRRRLGMGEGLIRLSVGLEDCEDLKRELAFALDDGEPQ